MSLRIRKVIKKTRSTIRKNRENESNLKTRLTIRKK
jgi:hypothetical protein